MTVRILHELSIQLPTTCQSSGVVVVLLSDRKDDDKIDNYNSIKEEHELFLSTNSRPVTLLEIWEGAVDEQQFPINNSDIFGKTTSRIESSCSNLIIFNAINSVNRSQCLEMKQVYMETQQQLQQIYNRLKDIYTL